MSFPLTPILDSFNRADEDPLANGTWNTFHPGVGRSKIVSSKVAPGAGTYSGNYWTPTMFGPDMEIYMTIDTKWAAANQYAELHIRQQNVGGGSLDSYLMRAYDNGTNEVFQIDREIDTGDTTIASVVRTYTSGDKIGLRIVGNTIYGYHYTGGGWTEVVQVVDTTTTGMGYIAFGSSLAAGTVLRLDDVGGGTLPPINIPPISIPTMAAQPW